MLSRETADRDTFINDVTSVIDQSVSEFDLFALSQPQWFTSTSPFRADKWLPVSWLEKHQAVLLQETHVTIRESHVVTLHLQAPYHNHQQWKTLIAELDNVISFTEPMVLQQVDWEQKLKEARQQIDDNILVVADIDRVLALFTYRGNDPWMNLQHLQQNIQDGFEWIRRSKHHSDRTAIDCKGQRIQSMTSLVDQFLLAIAHPALQAHSRPLDRIVALKVLELCDKRQQTLLSADDVNIVVLFHKSLKRFLTAALPLLDRGQCDRRVSEACKSMAAMVFLTGDDHRVQSKPLRKLNQKLLELVGVGCHVADSIDLALAQHALVMSIAFM